MQETVQLLRFEQAGFFAGGFSKVKRQGKWGYVDRTGHEAVPLSYDEIRLLSVQYAAVRQVELWGIRALAGREIVPPVFDAVDAFSEGLAPVLQNGK